MSTETRLFTACFIDADGAMVVGRRWRTTEANARAYFARNATDCTHLIGHGGLILAEQ